MNADVAEAVDLELTLALVPPCEANHKIFVNPHGGNPDCSFVATHRLRQACRKEVILICRELAEWFDETVLCIACDKRGCLTVSEL